MSNSAPKMSRKASALLLSTILVSGLAAPAFAQSAPAPEPYRANDEHGVDLATGTFNMEFTQGSIGPSDGGVAVKYYLGKGGTQDNWSGLLYRTLEGSNSCCNDNIWINLGTFYQAGWCVGISQSKWRNAYRDTGRPPIYIQNVQRTDDLL